MCIVYQNSSFYLIVNVVSLYLNPSDCRIYCNSPNERSKLTRTRSIL